MSRSDISKIKSIKSELLQRQRSDITNLMRLEMIMTRN